jgi:hypothetical protein
VSSQRVNGARMLLLMLLVFSPYIVFVIWIFQSYGDTLPRWFGLVALTYMIGGIWLCAKLTPKMLNKQLTTLSPEVLTSAKEAYGRSDFPAITIQIAYVSSVDHLQRFQALPWYAKYLGFLPGDFPAVAIGGRRPIPIVYFASGQLTLSPTEFRFAAHVPDSSYWKSYTNLIEDLSFAVLPKDLLSVSRFDMRQVTSATVRLPFVRVQSNTGQLRDFLVCSGSDDLSKIATETEELLVALQSFAGSRKTVKNLVS